MGNDGGSIPLRRELVKAKPKQEQRDEQNVLRALWLFCALSKNPLNAPITTDPLGKLYNKQSIIEFLLDREKFGDGDRICGYVKNSKDLLHLTTTPNPQFKSASDSISASSNAATRYPFICPLTLKEMNGSLPFVAIRSCGCVFSEAGIRAVIQVADTESHEFPCPNCNKTITLASASGSRSSPPTSETTSTAKAAALDPVNDTWIPLNPKQEIQDRLLDKLLADKLAKKAAKSAAGGGKESKKRKAEAIVDELAPVKARPAPSAAPRSGVGVGSHAPVSSRVQAEMAKLEATRKAAGMSSALKSIYGGRDEPLNGNGKVSNGADQFFGTRVHSVN